MDRTWQEQFLVPFPLYHPVLSIVIYDGKTEAEPKDCKTEVEPEIAVAKHYHELLYLIVIERADDTAILVFIINTM